MAFSLPLLDSPVHPIKGRQETDEDRRQIMSTLSGQIRTITKSVKTKADKNERMTAVAALFAAAVSLAEILSRGKLRESRAGGCKPDAFRHRLVAALSSIPVAAPAGVGK
jgi:ribosomal protein S20